MQKNNLYKNQLERTSSYFLLFTTPIIARTCVLTSGIVWVRSVREREREREREKALAKADCATKIVRVYCTSASLSRMLAHVRPLYPLARSHPLVSLFQTWRGRAREFMRRFSSNEGPTRSSSSDSSRTGDDASSRASRSCVSPSLFRLFSAGSLALPLSSSLQHS